uniref:Secreted protein n=1 Tax=Anopheles atroparvus TaxID=41427 RepID=A0A182JED9_ANOAO
MASKVILLAGAMLLVAATLASAKSVPEQRSDADLTELDSSSEERPGTIDRVKDFFGDLSVKVKEGVQDGVGKVKEGVKKGASKAQEYASNVREYLRDKFSSESKEVEITTPSLKVLARK